MSKIDLVPLLKFISPDVPYDDWMAVGRGLKEEDYPVEVWDEWSKGGKKYHPGECQKKWADFNGPRNGKAPQTGATITYLAEQGGWEPSGRGRVDDYSLDFNDDYLTPDRDPSQDPSDEEWSPADDLTEYLQALYKSDDMVSILAAGKLQDGKYKPIGHGADWKVADLLKKLGQLGQVTTTDNDGGVVTVEQVQKAIGADGNSSWICINPTDGKGRSNGNVVEYRYTLVESDDMPVDQQAMIMKELNLPVLAMVSSGGKSIHAVVRIDAGKDRDLYVKRVQQLYRICQQFGMTLDRANKNPARLTRLPGVRRGDRKQYLLATHMGAKDWDTWEKWTKEYFSAYPTSDSLDAVCDNPPELSPVLIDGVLRQNERMMIAGESKAGKSFLAIELCIALGTGGQWLGHQCRKTSVLYVNLEVPKESCIDRVLKVCGKMGVNPHLQGVHVWTLRDEVLDEDRIVKACILEIRRIKWTYKVDIGCIVLDPIYVLNSGDENSAQDTTKLLKHFADIGKRIGAAIVFVHHYSKGAAMYGTAINRASGSSVFGRWVDTSVSMTRLEPPKDWEPPDDDDADELEQKFAFRLVFDVRTFPRQPDVFTYFDPPIHVIDDTGTLEGWAEVGTRKSGQQKGRSTQSAEKEERRKRVAERIQTGQTVTIKALSQMFHVTPKTIRSDIEAIRPEHPDGSPVWAVKDGMVTISPAPHP